MEYSKKDVMQYVEEEDVKFIRLLFLDINGVIKNISIMTNELEKAFDQGIVIDTRGIKGFEDYKKILLKPEPSTISVLPWRPSQGRVIRMFCTMHHLDGREIETSLRKLLKDTIKKYEDVASEILMRGSFQFYLFKNDEHGVQTNVPYDEGGYMDIAPLDKGENVRREIRLSLSEMDIETCESFHGEAPGQNNIALVEKDPIRSCEDSLTFTSVAKTMAAKNGLSADFKHLPEGGTIPSIHSIVIKAPAEKLHIYANRLKSHYSEMYFALNRDEYPYAFNTEKVEVDECLNEITVNGLSSSSNLYLAYSLVIAALGYEKEGTNADVSTLENAKNAAFASDFVKENIPEAILKKYL